MLIEEVQNLITYEQQECLLGRRTAKSEAKAKRVFALMTPADTTTSLYTTQSVAQHGSLSSLLIQSRLIHASWNCLRPFYLHTASFVLPAARAPTPSQPALQGQREESSWLSAILRCPTSSMIRGFRENSTRMDSWAFPTSSPSPVTTRKVLVPPCGPEPGSDS